MFRAKSIDPLLYSYDDTRKSFADADAVAAAIIEVDIGHNSCVRGQIWPKWQITQV